MKKHDWTFITNHAAVLTLLNEDNNRTAREIGRILNLTSRTVYSIIHDLEKEGYINKNKSGRRNHYIINNKLPLRRDRQRDVQVIDLLAVISNQK